MDDESSIERNIEKSNRETSDAVLPKGTEPQPKKVKPKDDKKSIGENIKELVKQKFDEGFEVKEGDFVKVRECRPLSKIIHFIVIEVLRRAEK